MYGGCAVPINKNIVVLILIRLLSNGSFFFDASGVVSFNFRSKKWTNLKNSPELSHFGFYDHPDVSCSCAFEKSYDV